MRCGSLTLAGALAVLGCSVVSAPALAAASPTQATAPAAHASGLLDGLGLGGSGGGGAGLGDVVGDLLGSGDEQQRLQDLLGLLQGGQAPTGALLDPVRRLLDQVAASPGLPASVQGLVQQIRDLLSSVGDGESLPSNVAMPVATLLRDLAETQGVPADAASLLRQLADALDGDGSVAGLPVEDLSLPPALIAQLGDLLSQLEQGGAPTGTLLAPVGALLDQAAEAPGLPDETSSLLGQLGDALASTTGALDPLLLSQLSLALRSIAATPGVSNDTRTTIERIATLLDSQGQGGSAAAGKTRAATARDRAVIKRISVNRARTRIVVRIACPRSAPTACATVVRASLAGRKAAQGKHARIGAGHTKVVRLRMVRAARASSVQHGGRLRVRVTTSFGSRRFAVAKALRLKSSTR